MHRSQASRALQHRNPLRCQHWARTPWCAQQRWCHPGADRGWVEWTSQLGRTKTQIGPSYNKFKLIKDVELIIINQIQNIKNTKQCWLYCTQCLFHLLHPRQPGFRTKPSRLLSLPHVCPWEHGDAVDHSTLPQLGAPENVGLVLRCHQQCAVVPFSGSIDRGRIKDQCDWLDLQVLSP